MEQKSRKIANKADPHHTPHLGHSGELWMINIQPKKIFDVPFHSGVVERVHNIAYTYILKIGRVRPVELVMCTRVRGVHVVEQFYFWLDEYFQSSQVLLLIRVLTDK